MSEEPNALGSPLIVTDPIVNKTPNLSNSNEGGNLRPARSTRNPEPNYIEALIAEIDFSKPPPPFGPYAGNSKVSSTPADPSTRSWSASPADLAAINRSIRGI